MVNDSKRMGNGTMKKLKKRKDDMTRKNCR